MDNKLLQGKNLNKHDYQKIKLYSCCESCVTGDMSWKPIYARIKEEQLLII